MAQVTHEAVCTLSFRIRRAYHHNHHHQQHHFAISRQPNMIFLSVYAYESMCVRSIRRAFSRASQQGGRGRDRGRGRPSCRPPSPQPPAAKHPSIHPSIHPSKVFSLLCLLISALTSKKKTSGPSGTHLPSQTGCLHHHHTHAPFSTPGTYIHTYIPLRRSFVP